MKKIITTLFLTTAVLLNIQFINAQSSSETAEINLEESSIHWLGKKVTGEHSGTISLSSGSLTMKEKSLVGGSFEVDMSSIVCTDIKDETYKEKLEKHLRSDDFFGVEKHPKAKLVFSKIRSKGENTYEVIANLTIKGITNPVKFDIKLLDTNTFSTKVVVDRSKYDIRYGSNSFFENLGDKTIYDDFELDVTLKL